MHDAELRRGPGRCHRGLWMEHLQGANRREDGGDSQLLPQEGGGGIDVRHIDQDARTEGDPVEGQPVAPQGGFRLGTAHQIVPGSLVNTTAGFLDNFLVADKIETHLFASSAPSSSLARACDRAHGYGCLLVLSASRPHTALSYMQNGMALRLQAREDSSA